jgi:hypothetical protein
MDTIELRRSTYTDKQWYAHGIQWSGNSAVWRLIQHPATAAFLADLFGDELVCVGVSYSRSDCAITDAHPDLHTPEFDLDEAVPLTAVNISRSWQTRAFSDPYDLA